MKSLYYIHLFFALFLLSCSSENKPITEEEHNTESTYFPLHKL
ncbi:hypothetical protein JCM19274_510 [Algibacter lectus]|uniref:Lipoprotein n=1 Tax=Algibacter lectus TaxID=221126 RepID=A0A090WX03_9FLAO|nr:hypothetical protein JCM19274_510 [Algibacter lectus]